MKLRLATNYGADDKFNILQDTLAVSHPFFDEVVIFNTAPEVLANKWKDMTLPPNCRIEDVGYYMGYYETARRLSFKGLNTGDWVMWLDSDERPSMELLQNIRGTASDLEARGLTAAGFPLYYHIYEKYDGVWQHEKVHWVPPISEYKTYIPKTFADWEKGFPVHHDCFFAIRLSRMQPNITMLSNFGGHTIPIHTIRKDEYIGHYITHIKTRLAISLSMFLSTYTNIFINHGNIPDLEYIVKSQEYRLMNEFKNWTHIYTGNDLVVKIKVEKSAFARAMLKETLSHECFKNSRIPAYREYYTLGQLSLDLEYPEDKYHVKCGCECCKYGDIQL
jgi:hypothetical protein